MTHRASQDPVSPAAGEGLWRVVPAPLRRLLSLGVVRRLIRFAPAAVLALAASQLTYFVCQLVHVPAGADGAAGWLAGAVVSYVVSRWAWERRGRPQLLRETLPFTVVSVCAGIVLSSTSRLAGDEARTLALHGPEKYLFTQGLYLAANCVTFVVRFLIFHYLLFTDHRPRVPEPSAEAVGSGAVPLAATPAGSEPATRRTSRARR